MDKKKEKLVQEGNAYYEIDLECVERKKKEQEKRKRMQEKRQRK